MKHIFIGFFTLLLLITSCHQNSKENVINDEYVASIAKHRDQYLKDFIKDERAPLNDEDISNVHFFDVDEAYHLDFEFTEAKNKKKFPMATYSGITKPYELYGSIKCQLNDKDIELELYRNVRMSSVPVYADHLFLPFKDLTNGEESYGGGRYIDVKASSIKDGRIKIDFNKAYNPWCAYSDGYNCPIPPIANHLNIILPAGESMYTGSKKTRPQ